MTGRRHDPNAQHRARSYQRALAALRARHPEEFAHLYALEVGRQPATQGWQQPTHHTDAQAR